jgi:murein DD-endopeptidase MepM/ murein hydrolase activator NlpD
MSQLHHDPVLDEATVPAPGAGTPLDGPREGSSGRSAVARAEVPPTIPVQRSGNAPERETPAARRPRAESHLAGADDLAELSGMAEATALAGLEEVTGGEHPAEGAPAGSAATAPADDDAADRCTVPVVTAGHGRHRPLLVRRRPVLTLAAALVAAAAVGVLAAGDTEAQAEQAQPAGESVSESVSVARALGIEAAVAPAPVEADAARLAELAASRTSRDLDQYAAAVAQQEADQQAAAAIAEAARPEAVLPVQGARLSSGFGARWGTLHAGIDLAAPMHTPEYAAMDGVVLEAGPASGFGLAVYIQHANGDVTVYGHMDQILVEPGQVVRAGDTIALLGNRGQSTGPHLHFEVHVGGIDGQRIDPLPWLRERGVQI